MSTSLTSTTQHTVTIANIVELENCPIRFIHAPELEGRLGTTSERKKGQIFYRGNWYSQAEFCRDIGGKKPGRNHSSVSYLAIFVNNEWLKGTDLAEIPEFGEAAGVFLRHIRAFCAEHDIHTIQNLYSHRLVRYRILTDSFTGQNIPLYRTCESKPTGDIIRESSVESDLEAYCLSMAAHVRTGTRHTTKPFLSATHSAEVVRFWSCGFLKPVIVIDQDKVKNRSIFIGGEPGKLLFPKSQHLNYAACAEEVLIRKEILSDQYDHLEPHWTLNQEWKSVARSAWPGKELDLKNIFESGTITSLGNGKGGIVRVEFERSSYVIKVGAEKAESPDLHIQNEFLALCLYASLGAHVPKCVLQSYDVELKCGSRVLHRTSVFYLIHEYIDGQSPTLGGLRTTSAIPKAVANHVMADVLLLNFDVLTASPVKRGDGGGDHALLNLVMSREGQHAFRIDAGGALFMNPDGSWKKEVSSWKKDDKLYRGNRLEDIQKHAKIYFNEGDDNISSEISALIRNHLGSDRAIMAQFGACKSHFDRSVDAFKRLNAKKMLAGWSDVMNAVQRRLAFCLSHREAEWSKLIAPGYSAPLPDQDQDLVTAIASRSLTLPSNQIKAEFEIIIQSKRGRQAAGPEGYLEVDLTSKAGGLYAKLSPFQPFEDKQHRPAFSVPGMGDRRSFSVEGVWQGLKVFENEGVDESKFDIRDMQHLKRSARGKRGKVLGHFNGAGQPLLGYIEARKIIYAPAYAEMLDKYCEEPLELLYQEHLKQGLVFKDYFANEDIENGKKPLSHASLVKKRLQEMFQKRHGVATYAPKVAGGAAGGSSSGISSHGQTARSQEAVDDAEKVSGPVKAAAAAAAATGEAESRADGQKGRKSGNRAQSPEAQSEKLSSGRGAIASNPTSPGIINTGTQAGGSSAAQEGAKQVKSGKEGKKATKNTSSSKAGAAAAATVIAAAAERSKAPSPVDEEADPAGRLIECFSLVDNTCVRIFKNILAAQTFFDDRPDFSPPKLSRGKIKKCLNKQLANYFGFGWRYAAPGAQVSLTPTVEQAMKRQGSYVPENRGKSRGHDEAGETIISGGAAAAAAADDNDDPGPKRTKTASAAPDTQRAKPAVINLADSDGVDEDDDDGHSGPDPFTSAPAVAGAQKRARGQAGPSSGGKMTKKGRK